MALSKDVLDRIEAMMDRGQNFSEPEMLSCTDRILDMLHARWPKSTPAARAKTLARAGILKRTQAVNWLDLPSLPELLETRQRLLQTHGKGLFSDPAEANAEN